MRDTEPGATASYEVRSPKLSQIVADRLRADIVCGVLQVGSTLLPENELLSAFNVSRPTMREALRILESENLISISRGARSGATILGPSQSKAIDYTTLLLAAGGVTMLQLHEARMFFEPPIVRQMGESMPGGTIERLAIVITSMRASLKAGRSDQFVRETNRFHEILAKSSGNPAIILLIGILQDITDGVYRASIVQARIRSADVLQRNLEKTMQGYQTMFDLLEKGKAVEAAAFWHRYMERAMIFLRKTGIGDYLILHNGAGIQPPAN